MGALQAVALSGPETKHLAETCAGQSYFRIHWPVPGDSLGCPHWHVVEIKIWEVAQHSIIYGVSHLNVSCTPGVRGEELG